MIDDRHDSNVPEVNHGCGTQFNENYAENTVAQCVGEEGLRTLLKYVIIKKRLYTRLNSYVHSASLLTSLVAINFAK